MGEVIAVPVVKSKGVVEIDLDTLPDEVYKEALKLGLKTLVNRGTSKITKTTYPDEAELKAAAQAKADEQVELIKAGKIKFAGGRKKTGGAVMTEARRLAKNLVKDELKKAGQKISHYPASEITKAANAILDTDMGKTLIKKAEENLAARSNVVVEGIDITSLISPDANLVAKAEEKKAKEKANRPLSAKQAGKTASRAKKGQSAQA